MSAAKDTKPDPVVVVDDPVVEANLKAQAARDLIAQAQRDEREAMEVVAADNAVKVAARERREAEFAARAPAALNAALQRVHAERDAAQQAFAAAVLESAVGQAYARLRRTLWDEFSIAGWMEAEARKAGHTSQALRPEMPSSEFGLFDRMVAMVDDAASAESARIGLQWSAVRNAYVAGESDRVLPAAWEEPADHVE